MESDLFHTSSLVTGSYDGTGVLLPVLSKGSSALGRDGSEQRRGSPAVLGEIQNKALVASGVALSTLTADPDSCLCNSSMIYTNFEDLLSK